LVNGENAITAQGLVKRFKGKRGMVTAVDRVSFDVKRGETFGLIGPDGAGKTTTTRLVLGLLSRTAGASTVLGYDSMRDTYTVRERVGYIAQQFALPPDLTVMENMRFFAAVQGIGGRQQRQRIPELLDFAGLGPFTGRLSGQLSGGMKKKLALACSLIHEPQLVVLDEPTLGVDPVSRREFWNLLGNLRSEKGLTVLVCTPYMDEAERCNRVGLMYRGRLIACDTPRAIKRTAPGRLLEFTPSNFQAARRLLEDRAEAGLEGILEIQTYGLMLHVFVDDAELRGREISAALGERNITCEGMREIEVRMEEAFISLIRRERGK
jgi:ABC-2 type transport system ATP-binding protein